MNYLTRAVQALPYYTPKHITKYIMKENIVKVRKDHTCDYCHEIIKKGELADNHRGRLPVYNEDNVQVGIEYFNIYYHHSIGICHKKTGEIITTHDSPPIPIRDHDWSAIRKNYDIGDNIGYGKTEQEAIQDLLCKEDLS